MAVIKYFDAMGRGADMSDMDLILSVANSPGRLDSFTQSQWDFDTTEVVATYDHGSFFAWLYISELRAPVFLMESVFYYDFLLRPLGEFRGINLRYNANDDFSNGVHIFDALGGNDAIQGNRYSDFLSGFSGNDALTGGAGRDTLVGGAGSDLLRGSSGNDLFRYERVSDSGVSLRAMDVIADFTRGQDRIDLRIIDANTSNAAGTNDSFLGFISASQAFTAPGQMKLVAGVLYCNTDGDSSAELAIKLSGVASLSITDLIL